MSRNVRKFGWNWTALSKHVEELLRDIEEAGEAVDDLYMLWNSYGPGTYNKHFSRLTKNAILRAFELKGIERRKVRIRSGKGGKVTLTIVGGEGDGHKA